MVVMVLLDQSVINNNPNDPSGLVDPDRRRLPKMAEKLLALSDPAGLLRPVYCGTND